MSKEFDKSFSGTANIPKQKRKPPNIWISLIAMLGFTFLGVPIIFGLLGRLIRIMRGERPEISGMGQTEAATALYDYTGSRADEIQFRKGETVMVLGKMDHQWWEGYVESRPRLIGLFPAQYVSINNANNLDASEMNNIVDMEEIEILKPIDNINTPINTNFK
eukprot:TRINITY_DN353_c0_g1_i4.p1 TRINITY_DN353_c0_g1~~TRINITY_DN353_c0_g1_i4.p1  ORF type:complete len:163 (+),score=43.60 TRINITY_DN353_c0_g1_i4:343-831(+)